MATGDVTLASAFNTLYTNLNAARTKQSLSSLSYTAATVGSVMQSQQLKTLESNITATKSASNRFSSITLKTPTAVVDVGQKILYNTLETAQTNINSLQSACANDSLNTNSNYAKLLNRPNR